MGKAMYIRERILNNMRCSMGSQWCHWRTGEIWLHVLVFVVSLAALLKQDCSMFRRVLDRPKKMLLQ